LERREDRYGLTPSAATFLVRGRKAYAGDMILHYTDRALCDSILQSIRTGRPAWLGENFVQDAWLESYSTSRIAKSLALWQAAGLRPQEREQTRVLDIACGCAIKSLCLAQLSPTAHVTCLDTPDVLVVARDLAGRMGVSDQVTYRPANLLDADLGQEQYDAVLLGQITYYLTTDQNRDLFRRVYRTLAAGGMLVIDCAMSSDELAVFPSFATLFLWANSGGAAHSFASYRAWLHDAGFGAANQLGERWLSAVK
jgi:2-polyprenyl-3-methyl-5-hydroxy-6-metoxy-1,4-benzoquinol methylase